LVEKKLVPLVDAEWALRQIHRAGRSKRCGEQSMQLTHFRWRLPYSNRIGKAVQNGSGGWRAVASQPARDLFGVDEKPGCFREFILRYQLAGFVDRFGVLFDGYTDDAGESLCRIFLGGQRGGRDER